jgi:hypothetical protein
MQSGRLVSVFNRGVELMEDRWFISRIYFFTGFFSHIKITGLAMKIVE